MAKSNQLEVQYEQRIVAFVDVLGFSNLVYSKTTGLISRYFHFVTHNFQEAVSKHGFRFLIVSDSIVLSAPDNKESLKLCVMILYRLQQKLIEEEGILLRGGVSHGDLYMGTEDNVMFGPALINAYKLESQAKYPRIILDRSFITRYYDDTKELLSELVWVRYHSSGGYVPDFVYLDYFRGIAFSVQKRKLDKVVSTLKNGYYHNEHIEKFEWFKQQLCDSLRWSISVLEKQEERTKKLPVRLKLLKATLAAASDL